MFLIEWKHVWSSLLVVAESLKGQSGMNSNFYKQFLLIMLVSSWHVARNILQNLEINYIIF